MVVAVVVVGWSSCSGGVWVGFLRWWCLGVVIAVVSLSSLRAPLSPLQLFFFFFGFDSFKSNYRVWVSSFWRVKIVKWHALIRGCKTGYYTQSSLNVL